MVAAAAATLVVVVVMAVVAVVLVNVGAAAFLLLVAAGAVLLLVVVVMLALVFVLVTAVVMVRSAKVDSEVPLHGTWALEDNEVAVGPADMAAAHARGLELVGLVDASSGATTAIFKRVLLLST